jgi:hypothetical protein
VKDAEAKDSDSKSDSKHSDDDGEDLKHLQDSIDKLNTSWDKHKESKDAINKAHDKYSKSP